MIVFQGKQQRLAQVLGILYHAQGVKTVQDSWILPGLAQAIVAIWGVNQHILLSFYVTIHLFFLLSLFQSKLSFQINSLYLKKSGVITKQNVDF